MSARLAPIIFLTALLAPPLALQGCGEPPADLAPIGGTDDAGTTDAAGSPPTSGASGDDVRVAPPDGAAGEPAVATGPEEDTVIGGPDAGSVSDGASPAGIASPGTPESEPEPASSAAVAVPIDCGATLPCRLESADGALVVTLSAADGEALDGSGALRVDFVVEALSRDASVGIERTSSIVADGQVLTADTLRLGDAVALGARDEAGFMLLAGVPINGHATFTGTLVGNPATLDRLTLVMTEAGVPLHATFANVPLGAAPSAAIDCANALPCEWRPADGAATLTLNGAAALYWNRSTRLAVTWTLAAARPLEVVALASASVANAAGETLEPYGIELAGEGSRDGTPLTHALAADETIVGRVVLRRVASDGETVLARVEPDVVEQRAPRAPRWHAVFTNVPIAAPAAEDD